MLLARLLTALYAQSVTLVATSNVQPDDLYAGGLQRERFLPAIALIKQHMEVIHLDTGIDYRLQSLETENRYYYPLTKTTQQRFCAHFERLTESQEITAQGLTLQGRTLPTERWSKDVIWFTFQHLCATPRSVQDYLELTQRFKILFLSDIPLLDDDNADAILRFIHLIDTCYDQRICLIVSAQAAATQLYSGQKYRGPFQRIQSRLTALKGNPHYSNGVSTSSETTCLS